MKNNVIAIMKKECRRLFGDSKLVFSGIILQGLLIYVMYTLMGSWMGSLTQVNEDYRYKISAVNMPESVLSVISDSGLPVDITDIPESNLGAAKQNVSDRDADLVMVFPANFDELVASYDISDPQLIAPHVQIWSNMAIMRSAQLDYDIKALLSAYERSLAKKFDVNLAIEGENYDLNTGADFSTSLMMSMIPMLFIMVMYQGCMAIAPESIAGEKERGTLGTLLATPAKRSDMALAKILSITIFGVLGATVSFLGLILSLPKMMAGMDSSSIGNYSAAQYLMILAVAVSTVLVFVSLLSVMSAYSKSVKEANSYAAPLLFVSIVCGMSSMFTGGAAGAFYYYLIPVFNSAQTLSSIFGSDVSALNFAVTVFSNLAFALICTWVLSKMFNSEKIVFDK
ncbi:MAG: ABC transporter permease subunit [Oscillospiraceae bacterium]|nr:ABC transporter permease subunit [Oscillospiraceae bacterium]